MPNVFQKLLGHKRRNIENNGLFQKYEYLNAEGNFDYEAYKEAQIKANKRKIDKVWATQENISTLADYVLDLTPSPSFGLCHGTRRGLEQKWFAQCLGCKVLGTEISDTAKDFENTLQWDMNEAKPEWIGACDFIYSNSLDHSYDPERCLRTWMECLKPHGVCFIEHSPDDIDAKESDPFGAHISVLPYLILHWGKGQFFVTEIIDLPQSARISEKRDIPVKALVVRNA